MLALALAAGAFAQQEAQRNGAAMLRDAQETVDAEAMGQVWVDTQGEATIAEVSNPGGAGRFQPARAGTIHSLGTEAALWVRLRLMRPADERQDWVLEFPMPVIDRVTVYQQERGRWRAETAGDTLATATWPEPGRYPFFRLDLPPGQARMVYVRIRHASSGNFPMRLVTVAGHEQRGQVEYLALGLVFGGLLLLIAMCLTQSWVYRDRVYAWYAAYALVTTLAVAAYTGVAPHLLWPGFGALGDAPQAILSYFAGAAALLFVRKLIGIPPRLRHVDRTVYLLGIGGLLMGVLHPALPKLGGLAVLGAYVVLATTSCMLISLAAWRRGDVVGQWVFVAYVPLTLAVVMTVARIHGWMAVGFGTQYSVVVAMAFEVPLLLVALSIRSRERHGAQIREQALSTQDALTGLLAPHLFHDRLRQVVSRFRRDGEDSAVVLIDLVNYPRIKHHFGSAVAEQSLLRSVIKLRRLLRDVDTVSRLGEARFGVILEGATSRSAITDRAARLIAAGLMPLKGLKPEVTLQFHIAAVQLRERMMEPDETLEALSDLLGSMSPRTRRPIRFLKPEDTHPVPVQDSSMLDESQLLDSKSPRQPLTVVK
ncbi:MAG: diguanylate cyclase [Burkholderiales bacterium]|nr:diguanylate cyclase [Burkholderiales bacterium]